MYIGVAFLLFLLSCRLSKAALSVHLTIPNLFSRSNMIFVISLLDPHPSPYSGSGLINDLVPSGSHSRAPRRRNTVEELAGPRVGSTRLRNINIPLPSADSSYTSYPFRREDSIQARAHQGKRKQRPATPWVARLGAAWFSWRRSNLLIGTANHYIWLHVPT